MTTEERQKFNAFQRTLQESPANRLSFFASVEGIEKPQTGCRVRESSDLQASWY